MQPFSCAQCGASIEVPPDYKQPFIKCEACGSHERIPYATGPEPKYKILTESQRVKVELGETEALPPDPEPEPEQREPRTGPRITAPAIAAKKSSSGWPAKPIDYRTGRKPVDTRQILIDALGEEGLEMALQLVAGYLSETDESRKRAKKARVIQRLMKSRITAEIASQAVDYAEKCPETQEFLWDLYKSNLKLGLGIFVGGVLISMMIHFLAHPGRGFIIFQLPFAVGFAYAANAAINMAAMKIDALKSDRLHYLFMFIVTFSIVLYILWGIYF